MKAKKGVLFFFNWELAEQMTPSSVVLPEQIEGGEYLVSGDGGQGKVAVSVGLEVASHAAEANDHVCP